MTHESKLLQRSIPAGSLDADESVSILPLGAPARSGSAPSLVGVGESITADAPDWQFCRIPDADAAFGYLAVKRCMDIVGAILGLILFSPLMLFCVILIKLQDGGPVIFRQVRVGKRGRYFYLLKFRSMVVDAESRKSELLELNQHDDDRTFKILHDPRITPIGRFMRRMSLDELPQLWNVLIGEMSLVGPRPALPAEVALYDPEHFVRIAVKPGLTCIWQVSGRSRLGFQQQVVMDLQYIQRRSVWLDLWLIVLTAPAVLLGEGAA